MLYIQIRLIGDKSPMKEHIYNNLFTASDKTFADANPNWALSADTVSSRYLFGYN